MVRRVAGKGFALFLLVAAFHGQLANAQDIDYGRTEHDATAVAPGSIAETAKRILSSPLAHQRAERGALLMAIGQYEQASEFYRSQPCRSSPNPADAQSCFLGIYASARRSTAKAGMFDAALQHTLVERVSGLDAVAEEQLFDWLRGRDVQARAEYDRLLDRLAGAKHISFDDAARLVQASVTFEASHSAKPVIDAVIARERARRYRSDETILIRTPQGTSLAATLVRPTSATTPLPTAMWFTIYSDPGRNLEIAAMAAAHGYAGLVVNARGKLESPDSIRPYEVEADDTVAAINWASRQSWSDGRVGMYGGSYTGPGGKAGVTAASACMVAVTPALPPGRQRSICPPLSRRSSRMQRRYPGRACPWKITSSSTPITAGLSMSTTTVRSIARPITMRSDGPRSMIVGIRAGGDTAISIRWTARPILGSSAG